MLQFEHELPEELVERLGGNEPWIKEEIAVGFIQYLTRTVGDCKNGMTGYCGW